MTAEDYLEFVLRERIKQHKRILEHLNQMQSDKPEHYQIEIAVQYNCIEECQSIASQVLGYYL